MNGKSDGKPILALRHVPHEGLGLMEQIFREEKRDWQLHDVSQRSLDPFSPTAWAGLVVLGGPMNVDEVDRYPYLANEVTWLRQAIAAELPVLGICLGSQLLAKALGARVYANGIKEIGWYAVSLSPGAAGDALFADCPGRPHVFQWHGDTFDLPAGAALLATSDQCRHQAFRFGRCAYGLQFHIEVTSAIVSQWLEEPGNCGELLTLDYIDAAAIRADTPKHLPAMTELGRTILGRWANLCRSAAY
jgi:GMP synthase-like glutamine amidotransferase